jgi:hypothetical protein
MIHDILLLEYIMKTSITLLMLLTFGLSDAQTKSPAEIESQVLKELLAENKITQFEFNQRNAKIAYEFLKIQRQQSKLAHTTDMTQGVGTGVISGTISVNNVGEQDVSVYLCYEDFYNCQETVVTNALGDYSFADLPEGNYYIRTLDNEDEYVNAVWSVNGTAECISCQPSPDYQISLLAGEVKSDVDLNIEVGASIYGQVSANGSPVADVDVFLRDTATQFAYGIGQTDATGVYSIKGLPQGDYFAVITDASDIYIDAMWSNMGTEPCYGCTPNINNTIELESAQIRNDIDFELVIGASISGQMTDVDDATPVETLDVRLYDVNDVMNNWYVQTTFDGSGNYILQGIPAGNYKVYLVPKFDSQNLHIPEIYNNVQCNACGVLLLNGEGDTVNLVNGVTTGNIDFSLEEGASISGVILNNNYPTQTVEEIGLVYAFNNANRVIATHYINGTDFDPMADGQYQVGGLLAGTYFVQAGDLGNEFFQREIYNDKHCPWSGCDRGEGGDPVVLGTGEHRLGVNFLLEYGGKISGSVVDAIDGLPINTAGTEFLQFYDAAGEVAGGAFIKADGSYISARALPPGTYSVRTGSMFNGTFLRPYMMQKYDSLGNIACPGVTCDLTAGNVTVTAYDPTSPDPENDAITDNINFELDTAYSFSGTITELNATNNPIPDVHVLVYDELGRFANWATTNSMGEFIVHGLPAGRYYALTNNGSNLPFMGLHQLETGSWIDILYSSQPCPGSTCDVTMGTPIDLGPGSVAPEHVNGTGYDFSLDQGGTLSGQVKDAMSQLPASGVEVNVYNESGDFYGSYVTDNEGYYLTAGFPAGNYYLTTSNDGALVDVKFGGDYCFESTCNPLDATPIVIEGSNPVSGADFELRPDYIFKSGMD